MTQTSQAKETYTLGQTIYKIDSKEKVREWKIEVVDNGTSADIVTTAGLQDGKQVVNTITITEGKNVGRSNETSYLEQATLEALATAEKKLRGEYRTRMEDMQKQVLRSGLPAPMLAKTYDPTGKIDGSKTLAKMKIEGNIIHVQPKYDGNRCMAVVNPDGCQFYTRKGDPMPVKLPHIEGQLFARYQALGLSTEFILDGELFSDEVGFSKLNGLLNRSKPLTPENQAIADGTYLVLFDMVSDSGYEDRHKNLHVFASKDVQIIPSYEMEAVHELIQAKHEEFVGQGHEGTILRQLSAPYEHKRTWNVCKYKDWIESEFKLLGIEEDKRGGGLIGSFVFEMETPAIDSNGKAVTTFKTGVSGMCQEDQREFSANIEDYIGKMVTVKYQLSEGDPRPRFGKFKAVRYDL